MKRSTGFILLFTILWIAGSIFVAALVFDAVRRDGLVEVRVSGSEGRFAIGVPAFFAVRGLRHASWTCDTGRTWGRHDMDDWAPALRAALTELEAYDDVPLLEIQDGRSLVRMRKSGGLFVLEVSEGRERVRVSMPVRTVWRALGERRV